VCDSIDGGGLPATRTDIAWTERACQCVRETDVEVDLIIERPGQRDLLVEIKSKNRIVADDARSLNFISKDWDKKVQAEIWSLDETEKKEGSVHCRYWQNALDEYFKK
jgi:hypothetical protein